MGDITSGFDTIANMGGDAYASQSFAMSSVKGRDGKLHVEKYMSSDIGNVKHKIREGKQAYSNSTSGMQKMAVERQHGKRGRKLVCEKNVFTGKEHTQRCSEVWMNVTKTSLTKHSRATPTICHITLKIPQVCPLQLQSLAGGPCPKVQSRINHAEN